MKELVGQTILVTGASGEIGAAIVERLANEGAKVVSTGAMRTVHAVFTTGLIEQGGYCRRI